MSTKGKKNISGKIIIIIIAGVIVLAGTGFIFYKSIKKFFGGEPETTAVDPPENNVTMFKCNIGKTLNDEDLNEIKDLVNGATDNKVLEIVKQDGFYPVIPKVTDENGEALDIGDSVYILFSFLNDDEKGKMFTAIADKYGITGDYLIEIRDAYRGDYDK